MSTLQKNVIKFYVTIALWGALVAVACGQTPAETVAAVLIAEAGGEGVKGMEAVREVIATRAKERRQTELQVVTARLQFSCLNGTTPAKLVERAKQHKRWADALTLASKPSATRHTKGANHYLAPARLKKLPGWATGTPVVVGNHWFYRL